MRLPKPDGGRSPVEPREALVASGATSGTYYTHMSMFMEQQLRGASRTLTPGPSPAPSLPPHRERGEKQK